MPPGPGRVGMLGAGTVDRGPLSHVQEREEEGRMKDALGGQVC